MMLSTSLGRTTIMCMSMIDIKKSVLLIWRVGPLFIRMDIKLKKHMVMVTDMGTDMAMDTEILFIATVFRSMIILSKKERKTA